MKQCKNCLETKELVEFRDAIRYRNGVYNICRVCERARAREWKKNNPEKVKLDRLAYKTSRKEELKLRHILYKYGLSSNEYYDLLSKGCEVCGAMEDLHVDHCHETGVVRGCLCGKCNRALGLLKEDIVIMGSLIRYTTKHGGHY